MSAAPPARHRGAAVLLVGAGAFALIFAVLQLVELGREARDGAGPVELVVDVAMTAAWLFAARVAIGEGRRYA